MLSLNDFEKSILAIKNAGEQNEKLTALLEADSLLTYNHELLDVSMFLLTTVMEDDKDQISQWYWDENAGETSNTSIKDLYFKLLKGQQE